MFGLGWIVLLVVLGETGGFWDCYRQIFLQFWYFGWILCGLGFRGLLIWRLILISGCLVLDLLILLFLCACCFGVVSLFWWVLGEFCRIWLV